MRSAAGALRRREAEEGSSRPALRGAGTRRVVVVQRRSSLSIGEASASVPRFASSGKNVWEEIAMAIERSKRPVATTRMTAIARELLDASPVCAIATVTSGGHAHVNTAYFAWSPEYDLVWLSEPRAKHSRNVRASNTVAVAVYDSRQVWGRPDRGIQLFGSAREADGADLESVEELYAKRFPAYHQYNPGAY